MSVITVRLDRLGFMSGAPQNGWRLPNLRGFRTVKDRRPNPDKKPIYGRVRRLKSLTSDTEAYWQYQRQVGWVRPWRITMVADDEKGIAPEEIATILDHCQYYRFVLVELAVDFGPGSGVDEDFVRKRGVFGKSRRRTDRGGEGQLRYGARRSGKLVRCYRKQEVRAYRVEVELHSQLLRKHKVDKGGDLSRVAYIIQPKHFRFVKIRWKALRRYLEGRGDLDAEALLAGARERAKVSLNKALKYLRRNGIVNTHRFLLSLRVNDSIHAALVKWAIDFEEVLNV